MVLKAPRQERPTPSDVARLQAEFRLAQRVDHQAVASYLELTRDAHRPVLVIEDGGIALASLLGKPMSTDRFLELAVPLTEGLCALHERGINHRDINPSNIVHNRETDQIKIIDLGIAALTAQATETSPPIPQQLEGTLRYIAPEQTGRMNRSVDHRADLYSLGVTFYEILTGSVPFTAQDPLELVHAHLARTPPPMSGVPKMLAAIVMRLLAKTAEERYQSAEGTLADLRRCRIEKDFELGQEDVRSHFALPEKLFGREEAHQQLLASFERARDGGRILLSVTGRSGCGKTALLGELQQPVTARGARFVRCRLEPHEKDTPHTALIDVGAELMRQILSDTDERVQDWRARMQQMVGEVGQVLVDVVPEIDALIGPQPTPTELPHAEAEIRWSRLVSAFFRLFADRRHPLVILLDDLQWADPASLKLIELLMGDVELHHVLLVCCYRTDELTPTHPVSLTLDAVARGSADTEQIELGPLSLDQIAQLLAEMLGVKEVQDLAAILQEKTLGNPLFLAQYLHALYIEELLTFDTGARIWRWDADRIATRTISDDVADLLLERLDRLPDETREVIELAACAGQRFDLSDLVTVTKRPIREIAEAIIVAVQRGILQAHGPLDHLFGEADCPSLECAFVHSRFQTATYERIGPQKKQRLHLKLGRVLRAQLDDDAPQEHLFDVVRHFEASLEAFHRSGLEEEEERLDVARLCLSAGEKAEASAAFATAIHHLKAGESLLPEDAWSQHYDLTFALTEKLYHNWVWTRQPFEEGQPWGRALLEHARTPTHRFLAVASHVPDLARQRRVDEALKLGNETVRELGVELLVDDLFAALEAGRAELKELVGDRDPIELVDLPEMTDPEKLAGVALLGSMSMPIYMRRRELLPLQTIALLRLAFQHGNAPTSGMAYATWGKQLVFAYGEIDAGVAFCRAANRLSDKTGVFRSGSRMISHMVEWIRHPMHEVVDRARETMKMGIEDGEHGFATICAAMIPTLSFCAGLPMQKIREECRPYVDFIDRHMGDVGVREIDLTLRMIDSLMGDRPLESALFDSEEEAERALEITRVRNTDAVVWYHLLRARLYLFFGESETAAKALAQTELADQYVERDMGTFATFDLDFIYALALAQNGLLERLEERADLLQQFVDAGAGTNLRHKMLLVAAEISRVRGNHSEAGLAYERAIEAAAASEQLHDQALANELAARHYQAIGMVKVSQVYLQEAYYCYEKWGASAKLEAMAQAHPFLAEVETISDGTQTTTRTTTMDRGLMLDHAAVLEASRMISREVVLSNLLRQLLIIAAENAGAERAVLLLWRHNSLWLSAVREPGDAEVMMLDDAPLDASDEISVGVCNFVSRTKKTVVLADAARKGRFQSDPYITRNNTRSLLCTPLLNHGRLVGVLYLENNLVSDAFTERRMELIDLLSSQAAISIDNANLYAGLEQKVEERTRDLAHKNEQLSESLERQRQMQNQLVLSEKMASLGNLVAGVAHELNTPIGAVVASADTATRALSKVRESVEGDQRLKKLLGLIEDSHGVITTAGERVSEIVRTLRNFARLDESERKSANINEGIDSTLALLRHRLKQGIEVETTYGELPDVLCYPNQLNQVFMNLLGNAVDAVLEKEEGEKIIRIRTWFDEGFIHVTISDEGPGIPKEVKDHIFDPGFTTKGVGVGTGLGLSICFSIVDKHGGSISVESKPGEGATFTVEIPA